MKVSLITTTYNSATTLDDTILSVLNQSLAEDIEYIIKDGGSTDNTVNIIKSYEPRFDGRLKWKSEKDSGIYDAMNKGIEMVTGDVIGILNSDDFFTSDTVLEMIVKELEDNAALDAVYGDVHFVKDDDLTKCIRYYSSALFHRSLMRIGLMPAHPSFYIRRSCLEKFGLYNTSYKIAADFEFLLRTIYKGKIRTKYLPIDMVTMRTGGASTAGISSYRRIMKEHLRAFRENEIYTNTFLLSLRYFIKIWELFKARISSGLKMLEL